MNQQRNVAMRLYLEKIDAAIASHPFSSEPFIQSSEVIERLGKENGELIFKELRERGLPNPDELGKMQLRHGLGWYRLHKKRKKILKKLQRAV